MEDIGEGFSSNTISLNAKPVIVRVKRKSFQSPVEAFWLEINERPLKRRLLDLGKLSISDSSGKEQSKTKKILVQHVETVSSCKDTVNILQPFANSADAFEFRAKVKERKQTLKQDDKKQYQLLSKARQEHEVLAKNARFEQIWKHRKVKGDKMHDDPLHENYHLYDIVRVDPDEERYDMVKEPVDTSFEDHEILNYMPLIREFLPSVATEIESDLQSNVSTRASSDDYVYDLYTMQSDLTTIEDNDLRTYPLVQVEDDEDYYDGPSESDYESDDSNAENNPLNEYPDEEISEDEDDESQTSSDESEELESRSSGNQSDQLESKRCNNFSEDEGPLYQEGDISDYDDNDDGGNDDESWKWRYR